eukprot:g4986.t1
MLQSRESTAQARAFAQSLIELKSPRIELLFSAFEKECDEDCCVSVSKVTKVLNHAFLDKEEVETKRNEKNVVDWSRSSLFDLIEDENGKSHLKVLHASLEVEKTGKFTFGQFVRWLWFSPRASGVTERDCDSDRGEKIAGDIFDEYDRNSHNGEEKGVISGVEFFFVMLSLGLSPWMALSALELDSTSTISKEKFIQWWKNHDTVLKEAKVAMDFSEKTLHWAHSQ